MFKKTISIFLLSLSSNSFAMDYSHPMAPTNTTECVKYATLVLDNVESLIERDFDRNKTVSELFDEREGEIREMIEREDPPYSDKETDLLIEYMKLITKDVLTWYRSSKYGYMPEVAYQQILADCDIGVMESEMEELERSLE